MTSGCTGTIITCIHTAFFVSGRTKCLGFLWPRSSAPHLTRYFYTVVKTCRPHLYLIFFICLLKINSTLSDPCFHPGYSSSKKYMDVLNTPCIKEKGTLSKDFVHIGLGDWVECQNSVQKVFNASHCGYSTCSFDGVFQPSVEGKFGVRNNRDCLNV